MGSSEPKFASTPSGDVFANDPALSIINVTSNYKGKTFCGMKTNKEEDPQSNSVIIKIAIYSGIAICLIIFIVAIIYFVPKMKECCCKNYQKSSVMNLLEQGTENEPYNSV